MVVAEAARASSARTAGVMRAELVRERIAGRERMTKKLIVVTMKTTIDRLPEARGEAPAHDQRAGGSAQPDSVAVDALVRREWTSRPECATTRRRASARR